MAIDYSTFQQTKKSGLRQTDSRAFTASAEGLARLGESMQDVGQMGVQYASAQQALHNDNLKVQGEQKFTKFMQKNLLNAEFGELQADGTRKLPDVVQMGPKAIKRMTTEQQKLLKGIPALRKAGFLKTTNAQILAANGKLAGLANTRVKKDSQGLDIDFKNDYLSYAGQLNPEELARGTQNYERRLARGALSGVYDPADVAKLRDVFREDVADTVENHKTAVMFSGSFTTADVEQRAQEIAANLDLNPKEKDARQTALWENSMRITRQRQTALEAVAKAKSEEQRINLFSMYVSDRLNPDGTKGPQQNDLDEAIKNGLRHASTIKTVQKDINDNKAKAELGLEDNSPAQGYLNDLGKLKFKALSKNWTAPQLLDHINVLKKKVNEEYINDRNKMLTKRELGEINKASNDILEGFRSEGRRNLDASKIEAEKTLTRLFGGSDQFADKWNSNRNELLTDTILSANILIERGEDATIAVEKVRVLATSRESEGIQTFSADKFESILDKARRGKLSPDDRFILEAMTTRQTNRNTPDKKSKE